MAQKRYAGLMKNDIADGEKVCVSFWVQGCPLQCLGCQNPETWDFNGGKILPDNIFEQIDEAIRANGIQRNFSILGGEPFCEENIELTYQILYHVRATFPDIKIYAWTGNLIERLLQRKNPLYRQSLDLIDVLVDGPYIEAKRDITLPLRGSSNQNILYKGKDF